MKQKHRPQRFTLTKVVKRYTLKRRSGDFGYTSGAQWAESDNKTGAHWDKQTR